MLPSGAKKPARHTLTQPHVYISEQYESPSLKCGGKEGKERKLVRVGKKGVVVVVVVVVVVCVCVCVCVCERETV